MIDFRGIPTPQCPNCGCNILNIKAQFDETDYEIGMYFLDGSCSKCGTLLTVPTPLDHPSKRRNYGME